MSKLTFKQFMEAEIELVFVPGDLVHFTASAASTLGLDKGDSFMIVKDHKNDKYTVVDFPALATTYETELKNLIAMEQNVAKQPKASRFIRDYD